MRSFLIRDILSDAQAAAAAANSMANANAALAAAAAAAVAAQQQQQHQRSNSPTSTSHHLHSHHHHHLASLAADYAKQMQCTTSGSSGIKNNIDQASTSQNDQQQHLSPEQQANFQLNSPLDALFQMTSSTFDALKRGEKRKEPPAVTKQNSKKKRKSRTAFTNNQIFELERRFRLQKYLSPSDRDEIAISLNLTNAQVITWFQNRRAKMKRDLEEQRRDIETASLLNLQKIFLESFQALSQMDQGAIKNEQECEVEEEIDIETTDCSARG